MKDTFQEKCSTQTSFINQIMQELQQLPNAKTIDIDFSSPDSTSTARIELLRARENLAKYGVEIQNAMREADRLCDEGPEMLSPEQFHALKEARQKLQNQYKNMIEYTDSILKRLDVATSLLIEFTKKTTDFQTWIYARSKELESIRLRSGDPSRLNESKREAKSLHDEITRNDDALREINQLSLRIEVEVRNYIDELKRQDPNAKHPPLNAEDIQNTVQIIQRNYETLIHDSNALQQFLNKLRSLAIDYDHHLNEVNQWLSGLERQVRDSDPTVSRDPPEAQLENLVSLSQTAIASQPKIEAASQSSKELVDATAATDAHDALAQQNKMALDDIGRRFDRLNSRLNDNIDSVRAEIASKDGVHQGLENLLKWLLDAENDAKSFKILPLVIEKLKDQKYADQIKDSELNSQEKVLVDTGKQVDKLKEISPKTVLEEGLDAKFEDAQRRFVHLKRNRRGFSENLHDVIGALEEFQQKADGLNKKLARFNDDLDRTEPTDEHNMKMLEDEFAGLVDSDWSALTGLATRILSIPDVSETQHLNESMKQLEKALNRSQTRLSDKHNAGNRLTTDKAAFNQKLDQVDGMLREIEGELQTQILDISIDDQALQEQREFCGQLGESLEESRKEVEELEKLGTELLQASGVLQKRKSVDLDALEDGIGQVGKQMFAVRKRQDDAERALHDLNLKINENDDRRHNYEAKSAGFLKWLEDENLKLCERQNSMKLDGNALKTTSLEIKSADKRWREKQPELGELRALMHQLCQLAAFDSRHDEIEAVREEQRVLDTGFEELEKENNKLENKVAASTLLMTDAEFLKKWISTKSRILDICTISPEPSVISTNVKLLEMNLSELEDERPKFEKFVENAEKLALTTDMSRSDSFKNQVQQKADDVVQKWTELEKNLKDRVQDLAKIKHLGEKFDQFERQIRQNLKNCEKSVDEAAAKLDSPENISKFLTLLDQVQDDDDFRRQNKNFEEAGGEMEELLTDATLKSDVKNRVNAVQTASDELSKKIDGLRKAAQSAETQGSELTAAYNDAMDWIAAARSQVEHQPAVSADPAKLAAQIDNFSSLYRDALDKEGTMMLVKGKLTDGIQKSSNPEILRKKLEDLTRQWDPLLQSIKDRKQAMDSVKKLTDDLGDVEVDVKNGLADAEQQVKAARQAEEDGEVADLEPTKALLQKLGPTLDGLMTLVRKIEDAAPGPDANKIRRDAENLINDFEAISKDCSNQAKLVQTKNDLRNQFEMAVISAQKLLDNTRQSAGFNDGAAVKNLSKEKVKMLLDDLAGNWSKARREVESAGDKLKPLVDSNEIGEIEDTLVDLDRSFNELTNQLGLALDEMQEIEGFVGVTSQKGQSLKDEVNDLVDKITDLEPIGRDVDLLKRQGSEVEDLSDEIARKEDQVGQLAIEWNRLVDEGRVTSTQASTPLKELDQVKHRLEQQKKKLAQRKKQIKDAENALKKLETDAEKLVSDLDSLARDEIFTLPIAAELPELKRQQQTLKQLKNNEVKPLTEAVEDLVGDAKELIRSAGPDVPTKDLEELVKNVTKKLNEINSKIDERDRKIESAVQGLGSYNDAYKGLLNWIEETEELLCNQKPPSADYKVTKTQLQNLDFQVKFIDDKQSSVDGFTAMMDKVYALAQDDETRSTIKAKADDISTRYNMLVDAVNQRRVQLIEAAELGEEFANIVNPLSHWLDAANKEVQSLTSIPTNQDKLNEQIRAQEALLEALDNKRTDFDQLYSVYTELSKLVGPDDSVELESTVHSLTEKYNELGLKCRSLGISLTEMKESITSFLDDAEQLTHWLDEIEAEIEEFGDMSIYPAQLAEQSEKLAAIVTAVTEQQGLVSRVVQDSNELCMHTSGSEAVALQYRIENLRHRYSQISHDAEQKINAMTEAIPLSEMITSGFEEVNEFINLCEDDLSRLDEMPLEEQTSIIQNLEADMAQTRLELNDLNEKSMQLQHLSSKVKADELAKRTNELNRAFNNAHDKVVRKGDALNVAEKHSRKVFDDLDYLLDWFREAHDKIISSDKPAIDSERLKIQLKNQRMMNDDIATERASLREIVAAASRVARELRTTMGGQELVLMSKVEEAKKLAEDTTELGRDRLTDLEQAYALCSDLDDSFTDISDWLDQKDVELRSCEPINTGMSPEQLMGHKTHNNQMLQAYRDQKPMIFKFEKNVNNLAELCSPDDAHNLQEIANSTVDRFREQEEEWKQRGRVLDETIEQSSVFGDRLDTFLSNLESANNKIRNPDPVSARPPVIQRQINDNAGVVAVFHQKEDAFKAMKDDANAILAQSTPGDPAASEVAQKVNALDTLWFEIQDGLDRRQNFLEDTLGKADRFWAELEQCQKAVNGLRKNLDSIHMTAADPQKLEENKVLLYTVEQGIVDTTPKMDSLRHAGHTLAANVGDDEKHNLEHQLVGIERDWATVTQIYAQMSNNLVDAMSKSMNFHELLRQLLLWLTQAEGEVSQLPQVPATNVEDIYAELKKLEGIRQQIDDKAVLREQLNQAADELYANAHPSQVNAVRAPMNELNSRWNKLYALINDRQQRLEKALLELGQFEQACQQLFSWIERTDRTLEEIQPSCRDLKQIEIELCKLKVIQNDIQSHGPSLEAILKAGKSMIKTNPESAAETGQKIENLSALWAGLNQKCHNLWNKLDVSKADASNRDGEYDRWALWVEDLLSELSYSKPIGGLPETAQSQLDDFSIITADVEEKRPKIESEIRRLVDQVDANPSHPETAHIQQKHDEMKKNWTRLNEKLFDKQKKLQIALHDAEALSEAMQDMTRWLDKAENHLSNLPLVSRMLEPLEKQIDEHQLFVANVSAQRETMSDLNTRGTKIQFTCEKKDAIPIKNRLISLKHRFDKVVNRTADRSKSYDNALGESQAYFKACNELLSFLDRIDQTLKENDHIPNDSATGDRLRIILEENKQILEELFARKPVYESTEKRGKQLEDHAPAGEKTDLHAKNAELIKKWKSVNADALSRQRSIEDALVASGKFDEALGESFKWLNSVLPNLESEVKTGKFDGDLDTLTLMSNDHHDLMQEMKRRKAGVEQLRQRAGKIMETPETSDKEKTEIQDNLEKLNDEWTRLEAASKNKDLMITEGLRNAVDLDEMLQDLNFKAAEVESKLKRIGTLLPDDEGEIQELLKELAVFTDDVKSNKKPEVEKAVVLGQQMQQNAHPKTDQNLRNILRGLSGRWDTIDQSILDKDEKLKKHLAELREHEKKMDGLDDFIGSKETALEFLDAEGEAQNLPQVDNMQAEHDMFKQELSEKQPEVDEVLKVARKHASKSESAYPDDQKDPSTPTTPTSRNAPPKPLSRGNTKLKILQDKPRRSRRQQKADLVSDKWKKLWEHTTDYDNKLKARREYLEEMKRLEGFTFDDWRERYLQWNDTGKARISDLFRRIDTSRTGIIPREAFIKGILNSKFPTTHLEMVKVSDEFDKGDGMISAKEFMNALRYDPKKRQPQKTEAEIIHEELRKETERCTCSHRFPITHLNTNNNNVQYGFGFGSTMKRMVRILRSTVMVRVGGGWERLDEFLSKHDPCRAAGRTNVHLHNVPENALDQMHEFKSRRSAAHSHSGNSSLHGSREVLSYVGAPGPISKIREKTDRSVPMFKKPATPKTSITGPSPLASYSTRRASDLAYNPDSKIPRPSPSVSRSSSRQNISSLVTPVTSRPQSRMSEDSDERPPSRIPSFRTPKGTRYQPGNNRF